jgi:hypothetical protein
MKTKFLVLSLLSASLLLGTTAFARGPGAGQGGQGRGAQYSTPARDGGNQQYRTPARDGSGKTADRGNPNGQGTPVRDGSGQGTGKGLGPKDGSNPNCPKG